MEDILTLPRQKESMDLKNEKYKLLSSMILNQRILSTNSEILKNMRKLKTNNLKTKRSPSSNNQSDMLMAYNPQLYIEKNETPNSKPKLNTR